MNHPTPPTPGRAEPRISVVLPIYRTARFLRELHQRLVATLEPIGPFELVMVDDGSPDEAWEILRELAADDPRVKALRLSRNFGQHPAIAAGFEHCTGDRIVLMDADLQDQPEDIPLLLERLGGDVDVVYTTKEAAREPLPIRLTSAVYHRLLGRITGVREPERIGTFRACTRPFLDALLRYPERHVLYGPLMFYIGFEAAVIPIPRTQRAGGGSSYSLRKRLSLAFNSLISYTDLPHRFLVGFGLTVITVTALYAVALVVRYVTADHPLPTGLTLLAMLITLALGATMVGLGVIGIYVFRVYQEVLRRPRYLIARALNLAEETDRD